MSKTARAMPGRRRGGLVSRLSTVRSLAIVGLAPILALAAGCSIGPSSPTVDIEPTAPASGAATGAADYATDDGRLRVFQVGQMSVAMITPDAVIYTDPTGDPGRYRDLPRPDVILISHEHDEHYDPVTLEALMGPDTTLVVPAFVHDLLPDSLTGDAIALADGERIDAAGVAIDAVPSYGMSGAAEEWHPRGRGNAYVATVEDRRIFIGGSTEATPEMAALEDIHLALLPLYPPYALGPEDAVTAVAEFSPDIAYIYQYDSTTTRDEFGRLARDASLETTIVAPDIP